MGYMDTLRDSYNAKYGKSKPQEARTLGNYGRHISSSPRKIEQTGRSTLFGAEGIGLNAISYFGKKKPQNPTFKEYAQKNIGQTVRNLSSQAFREQMEGNYMPTAISVKANEYRDKYVPMYQNMARASNERDIRRLGVSNDAKVSNYMRDVTENAINTQNTGYEADQYVANETNKDNAISSMYSKLGDVRGQSVGLSQAYDRNAQQESAMMSGGGMWGEIASGAGDLSAYMQAKKMYSQSFAGGVR